MLPRSLLALLALVPLALAAPLALEAPDAKLGELGGKVGDLKEGLAEKIPAA